MIRASTLTSMSAVVLLLAGASIAALAGNAPDDLTVANIAPDIVATQEEPVLIKVHMPVAAPLGAGPKSGSDSRNIMDRQESMDLKESRDRQESRALARDISMHPESGVRIISATPTTAHGLLLALDVSQARAGKWTLAFGKSFGKGFGDKNSCCTATLTVHQTPGPKT